MVTMLKAEYVMIGLSFGSIITELKFLLALVRKTNSFFGGYSARYRY